MSAITICEDERVKMRDESVYVENTARLEALSAFLELREQARDVPEMSIEEIDAEIKAARAERRKKSAVLCSD
ncbi:MAG: hypothetical protein IJQ74_06505 [Synergistaceae bacterium]|nr:hypothetical protein [Synergistaceae bacterium]MBQ6969559.1 hypothetical protein [Synergistaceae bacterium]MBQ7267058.1 hypothetical protein [Synergistaceae bacterium]